MTGRDAHERRLELVGVRLLDAEEQLDGGVARSDVAGVAPAVGQAAALSMKRRRKV